MLDKHATEHISYVIRQCVEFHTPLSLRDISKFNTHYTYKFECSSIPNFGMLHLFSNYFDAMSIDVNKEHVFIFLTMDFNQDIP